MNMQGGGAGIPLNQMQMQAPLGNLQQMAMPAAGQMSYPMQGSMIQLPAQAMQVQGMPSMPQMQAMQPMQSMQPMQTIQSMQPVHSNQMAMSQVSMPTVSQLPPGAVTPLSSTTMMPVMGGIDAGSMNVVVPDLQPLSAMAGMSGMAQQQPQMARLAGGSNAGGSNWVGYGQFMGNNAGMWNNSQSMAQPQYQQQYQQHQDQQQEQQQQQHMRMKSPYDPSGYKETRNGLKWVILWFFPRLRSL